MRRAIARSGAVCLTLTAVASASAADLTVTGFFSQRLEAFTGGDSDESSDDPAFGATSDLGVTIAVATPTTQWSLSPGVRFSYFTNEEEDGTDLSSLLPRFDGSVNRRLNDRLSINASAGFVPERVDSSSVRDVGVAETDPDVPTPPDGDTQLLRSVDEEAFQFTYRLSAGATFQADSRNRLSGSLFLRRVDYDAPSDALVPSMSYGGSLSWRRSLSAISGATLSLNSRRFESDDGDTTLSTSLTGGFDTQLTPRHSLSGSFGPAFVVEQRADGEEEPFSINADSRLRLGYSTAQTRYGVDFVQGVSQERDGGSVNQLTLSGSARHSLNAHSSVELLGGTQLVQPLSGGTEDERSYFLRASLNHTVTSDWRMQLGYRLQVDDAEERSVENLVFLQLSRNFDLLR